MIDYKLVGKILDGLLIEQHPKFADGEERICYLLQETWKLAQKQERWSCAHLVASQNRAIGHMGEECREMIKLCVKKIKARK